MAQRYNLGPLTTAWSQPASCGEPVFSNFWSCYSAKACTAASGRVCSYFSEGVCSPVTSVSGTFSIECHDTSYWAPKDNTKCWPPYSTPPPGGPDAYTPSPYLSGWGFYSPALECPEGYYSACSTTHGGPYDWQPQFPLAAGETAVGCCPSNFLCGWNSTAQTCIFTAISTSFLAQICADGGPTHTSFAVPTEYYIGPGAIQTEVTLTSIVLFAPMFQINWQSSDRTTTLPANNISTGESSSSGTSGNSIDAHPGLSISAKVGIGAGVSLGVLAIFTVLAFFVLRRRRSKLRVKQRPVADIPAGRSPELQGEEKYELPAQHTH
ncbi:hypothetical protein F5Y01DRAFT_242591 [Xylaria sp. FL0043]|nr:hypothetical protein F5Y01DRAFT_242591 [Xylaria sp. FL0043]